jgi:hypothetical protein
MARTPSGSPVMIIGPKTVGSLYVSPYRSRVARMNSVGSDSQRMNEMGLKYLGPDGDECIESPWSAIVTTTPLPAEHRFDGEALIPTDLSSSS